MEREHNESEPLIRGSYKNVETDLDHLKIPKDLWPEAKLVKDELRHLSVHLDSYIIRTKAVVEYAI